MKKNEIQPLTIASPHDDKSKLSNDAHSENGFNIPLKIIDCDRQICLILVLEARSLDTDSNWICWLEEEHMLRRFGNSASLSNIKPCMFLHLLMLMAASSGSLPIILSKSSESNCTQSLMLRVSTMTMTAVALSKCLGRIFWQPDIERSLTRRRCSPDRKPKN